jgi:hypothetical protein
VLQRTEWSLERERDDFLQKQKDRQRAKARWGYRLAIPILAVVVLSLQPGADRRIALALAGAYYTLADPVPESASAITGPPATPTEHLQPDQLLSALSSLFPRSEIRIEKNFHIPDQPLLPFAHQPDTPLLRTMLEANLPSTGLARSPNRMQPWNWSDPVRALTPSHPTPSHFQFDLAAAIQTARSGNPIDPFARAQILITACLATGHTARIVQLSAHGNRWDRTVVEIVDPTTHRWILVDPDLNALYQRHGQALNAADLQTAWIQWKRDLGLQGIVTPQQQGSIRPEDAFLRTEIQIVPIGPAGQQDRARQLAASPTSLLLENFEYVVFPARNNFVTHRYPPGHPAETTRYGLRQDAQSPRHPTVCPELDIRSQQLLYPPVGGTRIDITRVAPMAGRPSLSIELATYTPNFDHFQTRLQGQDWRDVAGSSLTWNLQEPAFDSQRRQFSLEARSVNRWGLTGQPARLRIIVEPLRSNLASR